MKYKWIAHSQHVTREYFEKMIKEDDMDPGDFKIFDYNETEICIGHTSNMHNIEKTYGWGSSSKIILDCPEEMDEKEYQWWMTLAQNIADALNEKGVNPYET